MRSLCLSAIAMSLMLTACGGGSTRQGEVGSMEIDHIVYFVNDLERAKRFYVGVMGFEVIDSFPGFTRVRIGNQWLGLKTTKQNGEDVGRGPMMYLRVMGIQDVVDRLLVKGASPLTVVREVPTGLITTILDSEGNAIGLYEPKP